jgi:polyhydroxybutyrate depolymerase
MALNSGGEAVTISQAPKMWQREFSVTKRSEMALLSSLVLLIAGFANPNSYGQNSPEKKAEETIGKVSLDPGDHVRTLMVGEQKRTYNVHVPKDYDESNPTPVVLALHGAGMNGSMMEWFCGLNKTSDAYGFIAVYPSGTGTGPFLTWNAGGLISEMKNNQIDDVAFISALLDDLGTAVNIDAKRVYASGLSNGGMMCYRLAVELSDRIAAIAAVAGTMAIDERETKRAISVMHFHGTKDTIVPYGPPFGKTPSFIRLKGVEETVEIWVRLNGCEKTPQTNMLSKDEDKTKVTRLSYVGGKDGSEVVLVTIDGGGHTWPGRQPPVAFLGKSARNISANELIWEFFQKHPLE